MNPFCPAGPAGLPALSSGFTFDLITPDHGSSWETVRTISVAATTNVAMPGIRRGAGFSPRSWRHRGFGDVLCGRANRIRYFLLSGLVADCFASGVVGHGASLTDTALTGQGIHSFDLLTRRRDCTYVSLYGRKPGTA